MSVVIEAQRSSACEGCEFGIRPGQKIQPTEEGGWEHVVCPKQRPVCDTCFMEKSVSGACGCES